MGAKRITGRIGDGGARLRATTVSGAIALLRRPPIEDIEDVEDIADTADVDDAEPRDPFRKDS